MHTLELISGRRRSNSVCRGSSFRDSVAAVELTFGGGIAAKVDQPDVVGFGVRVATPLGTHAADQELVLPCLHTFMCPRMP